MALQAAQAQGHKRGVVVMATGLGKTWLAALMCARCRRPACCLLPIGGEILTQARQTFLHMVPRANSGLYHGQQQDEADWLFASIQTLGRVSICCALHRITSITWWSMSFIMPPHPPTGAC